MQCDGRQRISIEIAHESREVFPFITGPIATVENFQAYDIGEFAAFDCQCGSYVRDGARNLRL